MTEEALSYHHHQVEFINACENFNSDDGLDMRTLVSFGFTRNAIQWRGNSNRFERLQDDDDDDAAGDGGASLSFVRLPQINKERLWLCAAVACSSSIAASYDCGLPSLLLLLLLYYFLSAGKLTQSLGMMSFPNYSQTDACNNFARVTILPTRCIVVSAN